MTRKQYYKGLVCIIASAFFFSLMAVFVRLSGDLPFIQKSFFRNFIAAIAAFAIQKKEGTGFGFKKENLGFLLLRSVFGTIGIWCNFYAIGYLMLPDANILNKMSPFFAVTASIFVLKEKLSRFQLAVIAAALIGAAFVIKPSFANVSFGPAMIGLLGGFGAGVAYTMVRLLGSRGERGPVVVMFFSLFSCIFCLIPMLFTYEHMTVYQTCMLLLAGAAAAGGQLTVTAAYFNAPANRISVYDYSSVIFATIWSVFFFGELPDLWSFLGYFIITCAAAVNFIKNYRETRE